MLKSSYAKPHGVPRPSRALCAGCSAHGASSNWPPRAFGLLLSYWFDVAAPGHHGPMSDLGHDSMTGRTCLLLCALLHALASISSPSVVQDLVVAYIMTQHIPHRELRRVKKKKKENPRRLGSSLGAQNRKSSHPNQCLVWFIVTSQLRPSP